MSAIRARYAFVSVSELTKYEHGDHAIQNSVAQKLEPLVIGPTRAAMRECRLEQSGILALVTQSVAQPIRCNFQCDIRRPAESY